MALRIEKVSEFKRIIDIVYPEGDNAEPSVESLRMLREKAATFSLRRQTTLEEAQHLAIENFVSKKVMSPHAMETPEEVTDRHCRVLVRNGVVIEIYGSDLFFGGQLTYFQNPKIDNPLARKYPGAVALVSYYMNI